MISLFFFYPYVPFDVHLEFQAHVAPKHKHAVIPDRGIVYIFP